MFANVNRIGLTIGRPPHFDSEVRRPINPDYRFGQLSPYVARGDSQLLDITNRFPTRPSCQLDVAPIAFLQENAHLPAHHVASLVPFSCTVGPNSMLAMSRLLLSVIRAPSDVSDFCVADMKEHRFTLASRGFLPVDEHGLYDAVRLHGEFHRVSLLITGCAAAGKTSMFIELARDYDRVLIVAISNMLADDLEDRLVTAGVNATVLTQHAPLFDGRVYDLVIIDEVYALDRPHVCALATLAPISIAVGDPAQITAVPFHHDPMPFSSMLAMRHLNAPFSLSMPLDVAAYGYASRHIPSGFVSFSSVTTALWVNPNVVPPPVYVHMCFAQACRKDHRETVHRLQGSRHTHSAIHICHLDLALASPAANTGHLWTMLTRASESVLIQPVLLTESMFSDAATGFARS
jgi:hypothetical protein